MASLVVIFASLFGSSLAQFGPPFLRPGFGRFGNPNVNPNTNFHNSIYRFPPGNNPMNGQNGGMFGQTNAAGGAGPMGSDFGANMFGGRGGLPKGGMCPMLQGVTDMQAFKMSCFNLMQSSSQNAECTPGPWGKQCPSGSKCCPQNVDGACQLKCSAPIESPMRTGSCPTGFYDKPEPKMGWIGGMCFYAQSIGQAWQPECRFDGDCPGSQKCCSPDVDPNNLFGTCVRKCTEIN